MRIDTTEVQTLHSFYRLESLKEVYGFIWIFVPIFILVLGITMGVLVIVWLERKISAAIQQRIGPEYAGPLGILQALADGTKLLLKEDLLSGYGSNKKSSFSGGLRAAAQSISYEIPFTLCVLAISLPFKKPSKMVEKRYAVASPVHQEGDDKIHYGARTDQRFEPLQTHRLAQNGEVFRLSLALLI
ncbi:hypothetical protein IEQ34_025709 [Dendrobium chrysotoxum]|uniref:NADH-plastoquinone oxidoreductase subunit 1 n=1 Tax=Dendrobium chrysotoxum TaxID=161865 RepID=A0AAV7FNL3_DENCH|nr:hypothetical protein IEQ34_025709 [Dendrobium chrysotoxum]